MKRWGFALRSALAAVFVAAPSLLTPVHAAEYGTVPNTFCARSKLCLDIGDTDALGYYTGHDEPAIAFYSDAPGAGNNVVWRVQLPEDPPIPPREDGSGGTWNFQLRPALWVGMAVCDTQSFPEFTRTCTPDSDANIFDSGTPASPTYIGKHPGTAFLELQFYPPSWVKQPALEANAGGSSCDALRWCAALNIDSLLENPNTPGAATFNNKDCRARVGDEPVNYAFLTRNGQSIAPADPLIAFGTRLSPTFTPDPRRVAFYNSGDMLEVAIHDTPDGLRTTVHDLDTGETGSMTASAANGFAHILFQPTASKCSSEPYNFHPMYSTSSEHTRVPWSAHSYNVSFSDEIGHFEYCPNVKNASIALGTGVCASPSSTDPAGADDDDNFCFTAAMSSLVPLSGCTDADGDFDGPSYRNNWPGSTPDWLADFLFHTTPVRFTSPLVDGKQNFDRLAYEADLPRIEGDQGCNRNTGAGCTNPPAGASFYPFFTTGTAEPDLGGPGLPLRHEREDACLWREGGRFLPDTRPDNYTSAAQEFDGLLTLTYPGPGFRPIQRINNYRRILDFNPCPAGRRS
jgi:hypothetical protein